MRLLTSREMATVGGKFTSRCTWFDFPVKFAELGPEVRAHVPHDFFHPVQVPGGEDLMPVLGDETKCACRMKTQCLPVRMS